MFALTCGLFRSLLFTFQVLEIFLVSVTDFQFYFIVAGEHTLYVSNSFSFIEGLFYGSGYHGHLKKEYAFCCQVEWSINVDQITLPDDITELFHMLDDFLSSSFNC